MEAGKVDREYDDPGEQTYREQDDEKTVVKIYLRRLGVRQARDERK
jgi:hypothetical protein